MQTNKVVDTFNNGSRQALFHDRKELHHGHDGCDEETCQLRKDKEARDEAELEQQKRDDEPAFGKFTSSPALHMGGIAHALVIPSSSPQ